MTHKAPRTILLLLPLLSFALLTTAQEKSKSVKRVPIPETSAASGEEMYKTYCAACHGKDAKGGGPAAAELKTPPPDLTALAKRNGGKFPAIHVANVLRNGAKAPAHGSSDMPVWGPLFASVSSSDTSLVDLRISNLVHYLESLQAK